MLAASSRLGDSKRHERRPEAHSHPQARGRRKHRAPQAGQSCDEAVGLAPKPVSACRRRPSSRRHGQVTERRAVSYRRAPARHAAAAKARKAKSQKSYALDADERAAGAAYRSGRDTPACWARWVKQTAHAKHAESRRRHAKGGNPAASAGRGAERCRHGTPAWEEEPAGRPRGAKRRRRCRTRTARRQSRKHGGRGRMHAGLAGAEEARPRARRHPPQRQRLTQRRHVYSDRKARQLRWLAGRRPSKPERGECPRSWQR